MYVSRTSTSSGVQNQEVDPMKDRMNLGKDDFMRLLITELRYQDALNPVDDREMIAQLAQFSTLEQMQNLGDKIEELARAQKATQAASLIGRTVTFTNNDGEEVTGKVKGCEFYGEYVYLTVADEKILFTNVSKIS
jgi:flagellar basal-body rod modification protein FlgD